MTSVLRADVCVMGGGPAGATAATLLARQGFRTLLIDPDAHSSRLETLSPGAQAQLTAAGLHCDGVFDVRCKLIAWGHAPELVPYTERLVERRELDRGLRRSAAEAGVQILCGRATHGPSRTETGWSITWRAGRTQATPITARWVLDARGRRGPAQASMRMRTVAVRARAVPRDPGPQMTCVEALHEGWLWGAPRTDGSWMVCLFHAAAAADAKTPALQRVACAMQRSQCFSRFTLEAIDGVSDATAGLSPCVRARRAYVVGDATLRLDPLSGQGLSQAIRGGMQLAAALQTLEVFPERTELVDRFLQHRQQASDRWHTAQSAQSAGAAMRLHDSEFWQQRAEHATASALPGRLRRHPAIRRADVGLMVGHLIEPTLGWVGSHDQIASDPASDALLESTGAARALHELIDAAPGGLDPLRAALLVRRLYASGLLISAEDC